MSDLIKKRDAIEAIELVDWYHQNKNKDMVSGANSDEHQAWYKADDVYKALEAIPTIDAVSVVRCEDCKRSEGCDQMVLISEIYNEVEEAEPITYCSYGERKESE